MKRGETTIESTAKLSTNGQKLDALIGSLNNVVQSVNDISGRLTNLERKAIDNPVSLGKTFEPMEQQIGQDDTRVMSSTGPASEALSESDIEVIDRPYNQSKMDELKFMENMLTIYVHETSDPTDEPYPYVCNGDVKNTIYLARGVNQQVKRKYVEVLARGKKTSRGNEQFTQRDGTDAFRYPAHTTLRTPFSVIHDPAGEKGRIWLQNLLAQA